MQTEAHLGFWSCVSLVVGNMIGSGVFLLPSALAAYGALAIAGWLVTSAGAIALALVFARLARLSPRTGGPYVWTHDGYGEFAGFLVAWGYWIALWAGNAAVAVAFSGYLAYFFPLVADNPLIGLGAALAAIWTVTIVNIRGVQNAGIVQIVTTILKILPLIVVIFIGLIYLQPAHFVPLNPTQESAGVGIAACAALTLWAFLGLESATVPADDVDNPARTIPRATVVGVIFAAAVYLSVTIAVMGLMPRQELAQSTAPLADAASVVMGQWGGALIALGACIATFGTLNGFTLLSGQIPLGAARDNVFPKWFDKITAQGTPARSLIVSNLLASGLVAMNFSKNLVEQFTFIILLATLTTLVPYIFCALAEVMIWLRSSVSSSANTAAPTLSVMLLGSCAFLYSLWAIYGAGQDVVFYGFLLLLAGVPVHVMIKWADRPRRVAIGD